MTVFRLMINALIPPVCPLCQEGLLEPGLCGRCFGGLVLINAPSCHHCRRPFDHDAGLRICGGCIKSPPAFDQAIAAMRYNDTARQLILASNTGTGLISPRSWPRSCCRG